MSPGLTSDLLGQRLLSRLQDPQVQQSGSGLSLDDKDLTFFIDDLHTALGDHGINFGIWQKKIKTTYYL